MIQRRAGASFPLEALAELLGADLDGHRAVQARIARFIDLAHSAGANQREDLIRAEPCACREGHITAVEAGQTACTTTVYWTHAVSGRGFRIDGAGDFKSAPRPHDRRRV